MRHTPIQLDSLSQKQNFRASKHTGQCLVSRPETLADDERHVTRLRMPSDQYQSKDPNCAPVGFFLDFRCRYDVEAVLRTRIAWVSGVNVPLNGIGEQFGGICFETLHLSQVCLAVMEILPYVRTEYLSAQVCHTENGFSVGFVLLNSLSELLFCHKRLRRGVSAGSELLNSLGEVLFGNQILRPVASSSAPSSSNNRTMIENCLPHDAGAAILQPQKGVVAVRLSRFAG